GRMASVRRSVPRDGGEKRRAEVTRLALSDAGNAEQLVARARKPRGHLAQGAVVEDHVWRDAALVREALAKRSELVEERPVHRAGRPIRPLPGARGRRGGGPGPLPPKENGPSAVR